MWLNQPEEPGQPDQIPLLRAKAGRQVEGELTGDPLRLFVHYAAGRSWPCTGYKCTLCKRGIGRRFYAYYPVRGKKGQPGILELTAQAESSLISQMESFSQVPCGHVLLRRPPGKRNTPCVITWTEPTNNIKTAGGKEEENETTDSGPGANNKQRGNGTLTEKELKDGLMRIWNLPKEDDSLGENEYLERLNEVIRLKTEPYTSRQTKKGDT